MWPHTILASRRFPGGHCDNQWFGLTSKRFVNCVQQHFETQFDNFGTPFDRIRWNADGVRRTYAILDSSGWFPQHVFRDIRKFEKDNKWKLSELVGLVGRTLVDHGTNILSHFPHIAPHGQKKQKTHNSCYFLLNSVIAYPRTMGHPKNTHSKPTRLTSKNIAILWDMQFMRDAGQLRRELLLREDQSMEDRPDPVAVPSTFQTKTSKCAAHSNLESSQAH